MSITQSQVSKPRPLQTKLKHTILHEYLQSWYSIILFGLRSTASKTQGFQANFLYIDTCAGAGRYAGDSDGSSATVFGSPVIGANSILSLNSGFHPSKVPATGSAILIEKDASQYAELLRSLALAGLTPRVKEVTKPERPTGSVIQCLQKDWLDVIPDLVQITSNEGLFTFWFVDPYGPLAIPMAAVRQVTNRKRQDSILYVPTLDLTKKTGVAVKRANGTVLTSAEQTLLSNYDAMIRSGRQKLLLN
jgi:three-Cys-motif partner protein